MSDNSATIVAASLSSEELEKSIEKLVGNVATATDLIRKDFDDTVSHIKKSFSSIGDIKLNMGGSGTNKSGTGFKQVEQEAKSATVSLDNFAKAQQVAIRTSSEKFRNADTLETMKIQLELLRQRLIETRQQYSSFVAMAANATRAGDEGLYKFATSNVHAFETEAKNLIQQIRGVQNAISQVGDVIAPQGHLIQNWIASIGKVSPELQQLGNQIKNNSLLSQQSSQKMIQSSEEEISATRRRVEAERQAAIQNGVFYQNLRQEMLRSGLQAQETSRAIMRDIFEQLNSGSKEPIRGLKELENAVVSMRRAFFDMDSTQRQSPLGVALENDIKKAQDAITLIQKYNRELSGVQFVGKDTIGSTRRSYDELRNTLSQLTKEYYQLSKADRDAAKGTELRDKIHAFNREIRDVQRTMARPTSLKKALGLDESTLDHINDKLQALHLYKGGLKITEPKQLDEMKQVDMEINRLQKDYDKLMTKNNQMIASNNALGRSWNYMKNRLAFYFTVGASTQFIKNLIEVRSQYEMNERALGILINSAERGTQIFNELSQMALVSPYTLIELSNAAKQLTAYDIAAKDVVDTTRRLADMASAVGVPMERLTYALGQIKAYGYLNSRDARMFANAGIPLVRELSKYYSELEGKVVSVGDVYDRMKKKAIDYNSVMAVVTKMTDEGGKFFDFQAKMAGTLKVQLANLTLAWNNMLNEIGASEQGALTGGIAALKNLFLHWQDIYGMVQKVALAFGMFKVAQFIALGFMGELSSAMSWQVLVGKKLQTTFVSLANSVKTSSLVIGASTAAFWMLAAEGIITYMKNAEEVERVNETITKNAKESAESIEQFLESAEMVQAKLSAQTGKLPKADAEKSWEALREQIELSSATASDIIPQLLKIENINERLTIAFDLAERIKLANENISELQNNLDFSQDTILGGLFGEGLIEDIEDYNEHLEMSAETTKYWSKQQTGFFANTIEGFKVLYNQVREDLGGSLGEAQEEIRKFASDAARTIKDELGEEGLKDSIQVNEAVARILKGIEQQFPQIKGKGKALFESIYNDIMAKEFNGAVDRQAYYYKIFLNRLKKDHASAFQGVTEDIDRETFRWSDAQMKAIQKTANRIREDIPEAYQDSVTEILNDLNSREFKMRIVAEFATTSIDDINKAFRKRFIEAGVESVKEQVDEAQNGINNIKGLSPWGGNDEERKRVTQQETENLQKYSFLMKKANESDLDYQERISKERQKALDISAAESKIIAANTGKEEEGAKVVLASAIEQKKAADERLKAISDVAEWGGYDFSTKKENTAATKAQHAAETELQKALRDELQLIDRVRSQYKKLVDAGANSGEALAYVTNQFGNSLARINSILGKNGIPLFEISKFAGTDNPQALLDMLKLQLDSAKMAKNIKPEEIKELEVKYSEIVVDAKAYNLSKITKGLNNELDRLKDEYELAVSLDADPELGNMFADWMGIDVNDLPRTASEYAERASKELNSKLKELGANIELPNLLSITDDDMRAFEQNKTLTQAQLELVKKRVEEARGFYKKEVDDRIKDWDKLLEKYAEYEYKVNKIQNDAVKERVTFAQQFGRNEEEKSLALNLQAQILAATDPQERQKLIQQLQELVLRIAGDDKTKINLVTAISNSEQQGVAKADFEEFQKSPEWITATGDIASLTTSALNTLINSLENYKKAAKNLDPKQVERINKALRTMRKEVRKDNPFNIIANAMEEAKARGDVFDEEISDIEQKIAAISAKISKQTSITGFADEDDVKTLEKYNKRLKELKDTQSEVTKISFKEINEQINAYLGIASNVANVLSQIASTIKDANMARSVELASDIIGNLQAAGQGFASGGWIGAVIGGVTDLVPKIFKWASLEAEIDDSIKDSERAVKRLELAYVDLQQAVDKAYGSATIGAKQAALANKELQLAEIQRQIQLEKSRSSKNRDEDKIIDLQKQYKELFYEIKNGYTEIVDDLMGTDVASFAENLVSSMIDAFKQGEDYMKVFSDKFDEMIDNMIMKSIVSRVVSQYLDAIWSDLDKKINERTKDESDDLAKLQERATEVRQMSDDEIRREIAFANGRRYDALTGAYRDTISQAQVDQYRKIAEDELSAAQKRLDAASAFTDSDVDYVMERITEVMPELGEKLQNILGEYYKFGESSETQLSALQQGISGISETTAGALESYMNGVSQQVYYQSDLLTQIRDAVVGFNMDVQVASMSQILLQLRSSYEMQTAIHSMLEGWSSPNGMSVRVEMV